MRKVAFAIAAALMLLAGALTAEAMTGSGVLGLRAAAKNYSLIDTVACRVAGPVCGLGRTWLPSAQRLLVRPLLALGFGRHGPS